jgi:hypothetical protein
MTARDDAVKAAVEALGSRARAYGLNGTETEAIAETAIAAAAPILLAAERARIEQLFEQRHYPGRVWTLMDLRAVVHHPAPAETAPEEGP